ncbi:MAG: exo-alpha-sialidase [Chloroflexi bacterium]|nr:exo-alpha-sialidase [Chloroflexota bacterium]
MSFLRTHANPSSDARNLAMVVSEDGGFSWTLPKWTNIWGYPAETIPLLDGRYLMIYGYRRPPYGVRGVISEDGLTWDVKNEFVIRQGGVPGQNVYEQPASTLIDPVRARKRKGVIDWKNPGLFQHIGYPSVAQMPDGTLVTVYHEVERRSPADSVRPVYPLPPSGLVNGVRAHPRPADLAQRSYAYCAHPFIASLPNGEWVVVFNRSVRRPFLLHPPNDPHYYNLMIRSSDSGATWETPRVVPGYDWYGVECAGLTVLAGDLLMLNQWRFKWYPIETARQLPGGERLFFPEDWVSELLISSELHTLDMLPENPADYVPWARGSDGTYAHFSHDGGRTWDKTVRISTAPYSGGYGMRGAVQLSNGDILLPLSDVPNYRTVFLVRSSDDGRTWGPPVEIASESGKQFEEPSILELPDGRLLVMLRENSGRIMHTVFSSDGGAPPGRRRNRCPFQGYPGHCSPLRRTHSVRLRLPLRPLWHSRGRFEDGGRTWDGQSPLIVRDDLPNRDLGYPAAVLTPGHVYTVYYGQDSGGVTCIQATRFALD